MKGLKSEERREGYAFNSIASSAVRRAVEVCLGATVA